MVVAVTVAEAVAGDGRWRRRWQRWRRRWRRLLGPLRRQAGVSGDGPLAEAASATGEGGQCRGGASGGQGPVSVALVVDRGRYGRC